MRIYLFLFILVITWSCQSAVSTQQATYSDARILDSLYLDSIEQATLVSEYNQKAIRLPDYDTAKWTDIHFLDTTIVIDLRYATTNNFVETKMYDCARCFLRPEVAAGILEIHQTLQQQGYGLKLFDCYRPRPIQWALWEKVPDPRYVSDPRKGSMHNRGAAVDLTIVDSTGQELEMGTGFDFFGKEAYHDYTGHSDTIQQNRDLLKSTMEQFGFSAIRTEWWHYSYKGKGYELSDMLWACETPVN